MDFDKYSKNQSNNSDGFFTVNHAGRKPIDFSGQRDRQRKHSLEDAMLTPSVARKNKLNIDSAFTQKDVALEATLHDNAERVKPKHVKKTKEKSPKNWKKIFKRGFATILVVVLLTGGWLGWKFYRNLAEVTHDNNPIALLGLFYHTPLKNQNGRVNILVAGDSSDDPGHQGADLTDSIMILSLNTKNHTSFLLSIPRDTWVDIPSLGYQKINATNDVTSFQQNGYPNGGMGQLEEIINQDFRIPIDYYALINYAAFKDTVNAVGGITIDIQSPDPRGLYDPYTHVDLPNGEVTLNGQEALNLARARGDGYGSYGFPSSDFDRTEHQRQMAIAIKDKATNIGFLSNPLKVGQFIDAIGNNVQTNLKLNDVESLYSDTKGISNANIKSYGLNEINGQELLTGYLAPNGEDALIPTAGFNNFTQIQTVIQQIMSAGTNNTSP